MEKGELAKNLPPIEENKNLQSLFKFLEEENNKRETEGTNKKETDKRFSYWQGVFSTLNEYVKNGELSEKQAENYKAKLVVIKEQSPGNDFLTGLPNRGMYQEIISREIKTATKNEYPLSLLVIDIDKLKEWNDLHEDKHSIGDQVIIATAEIIKSNIRESDFPARWGGDEIAIILPRTEKEGAQLVAKNILEGVENSEPILGENFSISVGIKEWEKGESAEDLFKKTDNAAYKAKEDLGNSFFVAED